MDMKEHLQLILAAGSTIDTLWNTFIGVHFALITAIYFLDREFTRLEQIVLTFAYGMFAWLNYGALVDSYALYQALISDTKLLSDASSASFKTTKTLILELAYTNRSVWVTFVHSIAGIIVLAVIFLKERLVRYRAAPSATAAAK